MSSPRLPETPASRDLLAHWQAHVVSALRSIGDAVIATDERGFVVFINPVAEGLTGWTCADAVGQPLSQVFSLVDGDSDVPLGNPAEPVLRGEDTVSLPRHTVLVNRSDQRLNIEDSVSAIRETSGEL